VIVIESILSVQSNRTILVSPDLIRKQSGAVSIKSIKILGKNLLMLCPQPFSLSDVQGNK
jgi:hypothetical protein